MDKGKKEVWIVKKEWKSLTFVNREIIDANRTKNHKGKKKTPFVSVKIGVLITKSASRYVSEKEFWKTTILQPQNNTYTNIYKLIHTGSGRAMLRPGGGRTPRAREF